MADTAHERHPTVAGWGESGALEAVSEFGAAIDTLARARRRAARRSGARRQLSWYRARAAASAAPAARRCRCTPAEVRRALAALDGAPTRIATRDWPASLTDLAQPGLYSWWVDKTGAALLSHGLKHTVEPGRIYAGQTGATKWPSGKAGKATLASRIGANHLRGRIRGSTSRLTLASCLAEPVGLIRTTPQQLNSHSERELSAWMCEHL